MPRDELRAAMADLARRWRRARTSPSRPSLDLTPGCAFGVRYAQSLEDLAREVAEVKARVNGLLFLVAGALAVNLVLRLIQ